MTCLAGIELAKKLRICLSDLALQATIASLPSAPGTSGGATTVPMGRSVFKGASLSVDLVVVGLGYVGLPLAREAALSGLSVIGLDLSQAVVEGLNSGNSHVRDIPNSDIARMRARGFHATCDEHEATDPETIVICVPTPLSADNGPDLAPVRSAAAVAGRLLRRGTLVVLESTSYPGTTDEVVRPILQATSSLRAGQDFALAFSPERIDPGNRYFGLRNTPKVVGGHTPSCGDAAVCFYSKLCNEVVRAKSTREAEMAKLIENTYRHVNIALVNEMATFCHALGLDLRDAIACAATKPFGFQPFYPGPGVGGHCIPIDPNYLSYKVRTLGLPFRFAELAQEINAKMPAYVVERATELLNGCAKPVTGSRVLLLGVTYKKDVADQRESPGYPIASRLRSRGANIVYHDPYVTDWVVDDAPVLRATDLGSEVAAADLVVLLQDHSCYDLDQVALSAKLLLDTRGRLAGPTVAAL
jgi:UDP-N-acetyl-D-glucosamine dehydrogenase